MERLRTLSRCSLRVTQLRVRCTREVFSSFWGMDMISLKLMREDFRPAVMQDTPSECM